MKIKVSSQQTKVVGVNRQSNNEVIAVGIQGPSGPNVISNAQDVSITDLKDGSVLVYSTAVSKWEATNILQKQELEGGQF